ncbi:MAG: hypothetical protein WBS24_12665 [Terriglobales bacterium]
MQAVKMADRGGDHKSDDGMSSQNQTEDRTEDQTEDRTEDQTKAQTEDQTERRTKDRRDRTKDRTEHRTKDPLPVKAITEPPPQQKKDPWFWPFGVIATSLAGATVVALRGCWHRQMSWPVCAQGYSYQVCLSCGVKRLFDEKGFYAYGPFRYELKELIAWETANRTKLMSQSHANRPAS